MVDINLSSFSENNSEDCPFGFSEEESIISLLLDCPDHFIKVKHFLSPNIFSRVETQYIMSWILDIHQKHDVVPTRNILKDTVIKHLTVDEPYHNIIKIIDRPSNPRELPIIKENLNAWAKSKQYGLLFSQEALEAYKNKNYQYLDTIVNDVQKIDTQLYDVFWFFDNISSLLNEEFVTRYKTGFDRLDTMLNNGGPSPGEVVVWLAATNVGKTLWLCNISINAILNDLNVLYVTFEMREHKIARRCLGTLTSVKREHFKERERFIIDRCAKVRESHNAEFAIVNMPPDECSVNHIKELVDHLGKTYSWRPHIVCLDYLELIASKNPEYNKDEYSRQKHVSTEVFGFAKSENILVHTATQTNRSGADTKSNEPVDLTKAAESFGKTMPVDYVVSLSQSREQYLHNPPVVTMFIAKNREGPKFQAVTATVNYDIMKVEEQVL